MDPELVLNLNNRSASGVNFMGMEEAARSTHHKDRPADKEPGRRRQMNIEFLRAFARRIAAAGRIAPVDVAELRTHSTAEDGDTDGLALAEALFAIDAAAKDRV